MPTCEFLAGFSRKSVLFSTGWIQPTLDASQISGNRRKYFAIRRDECIVGGGNGWWKICAKITRLWEEPRGQPESLKCTTHCKVARLVPIYQWSGYRCTSASSWKNDAVESAFILRSRSAASGMTDYEIQGNATYLSSRRYFPYHNSRRRRRSGESLPPRVNR